MFKIALISPPSPVRTTRDPDGLPLGLCMLASVVRDIADVDIIDGYSNVMSVEETAEAALESHPDLIGISIPFAFTEKTATDIATKIRAANKNIPIIAGGNNATFRAATLLENPAIDLIVTGEGERTFVDVVHACREGRFNELKEKPPEGVKVMADNGDIIGCSRSLIEEIDTLPHPSLDLLSGFPESYEARLVTSRGCPFLCPYCSTMQYWSQVYRMRSPESVIGEMKWLKAEYGVRRVSFADDTYNINRKRCVRISQKMIDENLGMEWGASMRPDLIKSGDLDVYRESGMSSLFLGMESGSPRVLKALTRKHDLDVTRDLVAYAESIGINVHGSFMIGLPEDTGEDIEMTIKYAEELPSSTLGFHIFHPLPGCEYSENPEEFGIEWEGRHLMFEEVGDIDGAAPIRTSHLSSFRIMDYYSRARGVADNRRREFEAKMAAADRG